MIESHLAHSPGSAGSFLGWPRRGRGAAARFARSSFSSTRCSEVWIRVCVDSRLVWSPRGISPLTRVKRPSGPAGVFLATKPVCPHRPVTPASPTLTGCGVSRPWLSGSPCPAFKAVSGVVVLNPVLTNFNFFAGIFSPVMFH